MNRSFTGFLLVAGLVGVTAQASAQTIADVGFNPMAFLNANASRVAGDGNIEGSDNSVGTAFCYSDVFTVGAVPVDARVTLTGKTNGRLDDFDAVVWQGQSTPQYFQPNVTWQSGTPRRIDFKFEFLDGSSGSACAGPAVILRNAYVNSYDLDSTGSGNNTGQGTEFEGIAGYTLASNTELVIEVPSSTRTLIRANGNFSKNNSDLPGTAEGDKWRGRVAYTEIPSTGVTIAVTEAVGSGTAFYGLHFAEGPAFQNAALYGLVLSNVGANGEQTSETGTQDCFNVALGAAPSADVTVAISGLDTTEGALNPTALTFKSGDWNTPQQVCVTGADDTTLDGDIEYDLTLTTSSADLAFQGRTALVPVVNIDDESSASFAVNDVTVNEGAGTLTFTVIRSGDATAAATLAYVFTNGTAVGGTDFDNSGGTVTFAAGAATSTITVPITNDTVFERSETFNVVLSNASVGTISDDTGVGTILDDGTGAGGTDNDAPSFSIDDVTAPEADGVLTFTVKKAGDTAFPASVDFGMSDGTATGTAVSGDVLSFDYLQQAGVLTFAANETTKTISVQVTIDSANEGSETMTVTLANPTDAQIANGTGVGTIYDTGLSLVKTVFETGAGSCATAQDELIYVNSQRAPVDLTWCFTVTNTGGVELTNPSVTDTDLGITLTTPTSGSLPLQPNASLVFAYPETGRIASLDNTAQISMDAPGEKLTDSASARFAYVFDPPYGVKTGTLNGEDKVLWTMVWINDNPIDANGVVITDTIDAAMTYIPGTLTCTPRGTTTVVGGSCSDAANFSAPNQLSITANFGPDLGAVDEATANNELVISFEATIANPGSSQTLENQGSASWDADGPGGADPLAGITDSDQSASGAQPTVVAFNVAAPVPLMPWQWLLVLTVVAGWLGAMARRHR